MKRRNFIVGLGCVMTWPVTARGQGSPPSRVIGVIGAASRETAAPQSDAFRQGLRELGYVEGTNYEMVEYWANGDMQRLPELARALVRRNPDVILAAPTPAAVAAKNATSVIPVVCFMLADEIRLGLVASDARPGGNVTGLAMRVDGMAGKQLELADELLPNSKRIGILVNVASSDTEAQLHDALEAGVALKVDCILAQVHRPDELDKALQHLAEKDVAAIVVLYDALFFQQRRRIASFVEAAHIPTIYGARDHVSDGGLMSYGVSLRASAQRAAYYFDQIFKGAKAGDLPVEFPTKLELVINLKTAKSLGIEIPPTILARADEVLE
jgi:putative tryptophan/tyrosine transport system substrate-binding protein